MKASRSKAANRKFNRSYGLEKMKEFSDTEFKRMFRLSREAFEHLTKGIMLDLSIDELKAKQSSGSHIPVTTRLACALRFLAGGSYLDISALFWCQ